MAGCNEQNPMLNDLVLNTVFQHVTDVNDLKNSRLVCQVWRKASLQQWREVGVLVLKQAGNPRSVGTGSHHLTVSELMDLSNSNDASLALNQKPFRRYKLKNWDFGGGSDDEFTFQERLGGLVKYLHVDRCDFPRCSYLHDVLIRGVPNLEKLVWTNSRIVTWGYCPSWSRFGPHNSHRNLQSLEVTSDSRDAPSHVSHLISDYLGYFLMGAPFLDEISIRKQERENWVAEASLNLRMRNGFMLKALEAISIAPSVRDVGNLGISFRKLDIMDFYRDAVFWFAESNNIASIPQVPLEELTLDIGSYTSTEEAKQIFGKLVVGETLEVLKAFRAPLTRPYETVPFAGRRMEALRQLHLWGSFTTSLEFLRHTPNLQVLVLRRNVFEKVYKLERLLRDGYLVGCQPCSHDLVVATLDIMRRRSSFFDASVMVSSLAHLDIDYAFTKFTIPTLGKWLPNLTTLKMVLNNETLKVVCQVWPKLEELELLFGSRVDDDGVSCLGQMTALRKFKSNAYCNEGLLSSVSADQLFLKMNGLEELNICVSAKMTEESVNKLRTKIGCVNAIRNYDSMYRKHDRQECCNRLRFIRRASRPLPRH